MIREDNDATIPDCSNCLWGDDCTQGLDATKCDNYEVKIKDCQEGVKKC